MALHDISKSITRESPYVSGNDQLDAGAVMAHGTHSVHYTQDPTDTSARNGKFYIVKSGSVTIPTQITTVDPGAGNWAPTETLLATIPHNLANPNGDPIYPSIIAFYNTSNGWHPLPHTDMITFFNTLAWWTFTAQVDAANIYFYFRAMSYNGLSGIGAGLTFKYYLLLQTSN